MNQQCSIMSNRFYWSGYPSKKTRSACHLNEGKRKEKDSITRAHLGYFNFWAEVYQIILDLFRHFQGKWSVHRHFSFSEQGMYPPSPRCTPVSHGA